MAREPIVARTAWTKGGTTYVTIRWNGAVRTRVARPDGGGGWTITLPGLGDIAVILPATIGAEPTEGRLARGATMAARNGLAASDDGTRPASTRRNTETNRARDESDTPVRTRDEPKPDLMAALKASLGIDSAPPEPQRDGSIDLMTALKDSLAISKPPTSTLEHQRRELEQQQAQLAAEIAQRRSEAQAEWLRLADERRRLDQERRELEEQRQRILSASATEPSLPQVPDEGLPEWLIALPEPDRYVFEHLADHGAINEAEATRILGGARQFRRFSVRLEEHLARVPFKVRIDMSGGIKCYVRDEGGSE